MADEIRAEHEFDRYRGYLRLLARGAVGLRLGVRFDASDIVQETLLEAHRSQGQLRGKTGGQVAAWLRSILERKLAQARRNHKREKRDVRREVSLDSALNASSDRLAAILPGGDSTPSAKAVREEEAVRVATMLEDLPATQREAIVRTYLEGLSLDEAAAQMGKTPAAVASLVRRGLAQLRDVAAALERRSGSSRRASGE